MNQKPELEVLVPEWPATDNIKAFFTLRSGGVSAGPYGGQDGFNGLNLGPHTKDSPYAVRMNRRIVTDMLGAEPAWLRQVHSSRVTDAREVTSETEADASVTTEVGLPCVVMTADCVPVLLCDTEGRVVGASHAGWRGLADGVLQQTVSAMRRMVCDPQAKIMAWIGPHIRRDSFEVRQDVADYYLASDLKGAAGEGFIRTGEGVYHLDLARFCREALSLSGVEAIYDCGLDTYSDEVRFYSYRRSGVTGRHGAFICKTN